MRFAFIGAGAVGGYYGAMLARSGHDVSFVARGAHRDAIRAARPPHRSAPSATSRCAWARPRAIRRASARSTSSILAVKTYDNATAIPLLAPLVGPHTTVLTLQNGVDSAEEVAAVVGERHDDRRLDVHRDRRSRRRASFDRPGTHRRIVFGECFGIAERRSPIASRRSSRS